MGVPSVIAVTGSTGYIGERLVATLLGLPGVKRVIGLDVRQPKLEDERFTFIKHDVTTPLNNILIDQRVQTVVHLAFSLRQLRDRSQSTLANVTGTRNVLDAAIRSKARRIVVLSSATVYGARRGRGLEPLTEAEPMAPVKGFNYSEDKVECERYCRHLADQYPDVAVSVLRSCIVLGPHADNFITRALEKRFLIAIGNDDPSLQFIHENDLTQIIACFARENHSGIYNVAAPGTVKWRQLVKMANKPLIHLPAPLAIGLTNLSWKLRLQSDSPASGLSFIRWPWVVDTSHLSQEIQHDFAYTSQQALAEYLGSRDGL